jgi:serine/threonine protein kinase
MWQPPSLEEMQAMLPQYHFDSLLGRGGMGAVYKAVQVSLDRPVAIKVLPGDLIDDTDSQFAERFKNEARTMAKMNHPSIVNVYDFGETQTGLLFIVMEFIDGTDVSKMIAAQGKLPEEYALSITAHVCDALNYAHRSGVIHRDIKPANILINMEGAVKVADFGLAKQSDASMSGLTKTNMAMGTPDFVAPEALMPGVPLDGRADLYAIGVMLYQMLTGEIPRGMWTMPGMKLGTDPRFDAIIGKAMQTDREARYQSAADIRKDLDTILTIPRALSQPQHAAPSPSPAHSTQQHAAQGPRGAQDKKPAEKPQTQPPLPKKSRAGLIVGLGTMAALAMGGYLWLKTPASKTSSPVAAGTFAAEIAKLPPEQQIERVRQRIMQLNKGADVKMKPVIKNGQLESLELNRTGDVTDLSPVAALKDIKGFASYYMGVTDFSFLRGLPLERLVIMQSKVTDLSMLKGMPLQQVRLVNIFATDLRALADTPVEDLTVNMSPLSDLSFARKMPLKVLHIEQTKVRDLTPIKGKAIETLTCDAAVASDPANRDTLRSLALLKRINGTATADFWKNIESSSVPPPVRAAVQTLDLLSLTDPVKDRVAASGLIDKNQWKREGGALVFVPDGKSGKLAAPVALDCRDYEIEFKARKHSGNDRIHVDVPLRNGRILPLIFNSPGRKVLNEKEGLDWGAASNGEFHVVIRVIDGTGSSDRIIIERKTPNVKQMADWSGDLDKLAKAGEDHPGFPKQPVTSVFVMRDKYEIETWTLRVFEGTAKVLREAPAPPSQPAVVPTPVAAVSPAMSESAAAVAPKSSASTMPATPVAPPEPAVTPAPATDAVSLKLAEIEAKFKTAFDRDAGSTYKAQIATLNTGYTAALDRALAAASKAGNLNEAVALREEKQRMAEGKALPPADLDTLTESLKKLRATWRSSEAGYARQRDAKAVPLFDTYDKALEAFQTELTKQNKIDDALRVKTARDELAARRGASAPPPEEKLAGAKPAKTTPSSTVASEASSSWRKAAEWILSLGGELHIRRTDGGEPTVKEAKDLPGGRFDILSITLDMPPGKGAQVTDDDFTRLSGLRDLESVRLAHLTSLTGSGFAAFAASADSMRSFAVYNSPLQPQHMGLITQFKNLRLLELNRAPSLTAESLTKIQVFKELTQLRLLGQMNLTDKTLMQLAGLTKLTELSIPATAVTDEGLVALKGMKALTSVDLGGCKGITGSGLAHLAGARELARIHLAHSEVTDVALAHLSGLTRLRDLTLNQTQITDDGIRHLAQLKELQSLELGTKGISGSSLNLLSGCKNLTRLDLYDRSNPAMTAVDDAGLQALAAAGLPRLSELSFSGEPVTDAGMACLSAMKLTRLRTSESPGLEGMRYIAAISTLEWLELGGGELSDAGLAVLAGVKSLKTLDIQASQITDAGLKVLYDMRGLKALTLKKSKATQAGLDALSKARPDLKVGT